MPIPNLDGLLRDMRNLDNVDRAVAAAEEWGRHATAEDVPLLRKLMAEGDNFFRECLGTVLAELEGPPALPFLLGLLREGRALGRDNDALGFAVTELVSAHRRDVLPTLAAMSEADSPADRRDAAWLWGFVAEVAPVEPLLRLARDPDHAVRGAAVGALGSYPGREDVFAALAAALGDPEERVRIDTVSALGYYEDRRAVELLEPFATDDAPASVRRIAEHALKQLRRR